MEFNPIRRKLRWSPANTITKTVSGSELKSLITRYTLQGYMLVNVVVADTGAIIELTGGASFGSTSLAKADVKPDTTYTVTLRRIADSSSSGILF